MNEWKFFCFPGPTIVFKLSLINIRNWFCSDKPAKLILLIQIKFKLIPECEFLHSFFCCANIFFCLKLLILHWCLRIFCSSFVHFIFMKKIFNFSVTKKLPMINDEGEIEKCRPFPTGKGECWIFGAGQIVAIAGGHYQPAGQSIHYSIDHFIFENACRISRW